MNDITPETQHQLAHAAIVQFEIMLRRLRAHGIIVQVDIISTQPPRMGHYDQVVSYRLTKEK
jgi:hypothetical protein